MHMHTIDDPRELDERAVRASVAVTSTVTKADLERPTPCAGWRLADLLAHMAAQHRGFAAAAEGNGADREVWRGEPVGADPAAWYAEAAERVIGAFGGTGVLARRFALPEISTTTEFPAPMAIGFHLVDYVVHIWDVARSLGVPVALPDDLVRAVLPLARAVPAGPERLRPGAAFAPVLPYPPDAGPLDEVLALLGRSPDWAPPA